MVNKIIVTGSSGLIGQAMFQFIKEKKLTQNYHLIPLSSKDCNLENWEETIVWFQNHSDDCDIVIHLAASVGGLYKNVNENTGMFEKNIKINMNVLKAVHQSGITRMISCLSTCIFPDEIRQYPITEEMLHHGPPHFSNQGYAYAKRMLEVQTRMFNEQYNTNYICIIPTNVYGMFDNFSLENGHVIPSLIHQCYLAKKENRTFPVKGSGKPLRQFIFNMDIAEIIFHFIENNYKENTNIILSTDPKDEISIHDVALEIAKCFDFDSNQICFDSNYIDGQFQKTVSNERLKKILLNSNFKFTCFTKGIEKTIQWFIQNVETCRK